MNFSLKISSPTMLSEESYYLIETGSVIYPEPVVQRFVNGIEALDCWYGKVQTVSFCEQGLIFEADVTKCEDEISLIHLYAMTEDLDALDELEEILADKVEKIVERLSGACAESVCQARQIRQDQRQTVIF